MGKKGRKNEEGRVTQTGNPKSSEGASWIDDLLADPTLQSREPLPGASQRRENQPVQSSALRITTSDLMGGEMHETVDSKAAANVIGGLLDRAANSHDRSYSLVTDQLVQKSTPLGALVYTLHQDMKRTPLTEPDLAELAPLMTGLTAPVSLLYTRMAKGATFKELVGADALEQRAAKWFDSSPGRKGANRDKVLSIILNPVLHSIGFAHGYLAGIMNTILTDNSAKNVTERFQNLFGGIIGRYEGNPSKEDGQALGRALSLHPHLLLPDPIDAFTEERAIRKLEGVINAANIAAKRMVAIGCSQARAYSLLAGLGDESAVRLARKELESGYKADDLSVIFRDKTYLRAARNVKRHLGDDAVPFLRDYGASKVGSQRLVDILAQDQYLEREEEVKAIHRDAPHILNREYTEKLLAMRTENEDLYNLLVSLSREGQFAKQRAVFAFADEGLADPFSIAEKLEGWRDYEVQFQMGLGTVWKNTLRRSEPINPSTPSVNHPERLCKYSFAHRVAALGETQQHQYEQAVELVEGMGLKDVFLHNYHLQGALYQVVTARGEGFISDLERMKSQRTREDLISMLQGKGKLPFERVIYVTPENEDTRRVSNIIGMHVFNVPYNAPVSAWEDIKSTDLVISTVHDSKSLTYFAIKTQVALKEATFVQTSKGKLSQDVREVKMQYAA